MSEVSKGGRTILFVTHNLAVLESLCPHSMLIKNGYINFWGQTKNCIENYLQHPVDDVIEGRPVEIRQTHPKFKLISTTPCNRNGEACHTFRADDEIYIHLDYEISGLITGARLVIRIINQFNSVLFSTTDIDNSPDQILLRNPGIYRSICEIPRYLLNKGSYSISVSADIPMREWILEEQILAKFTVDVAGAIGSIYSDDRLGIFRPLLIWSTIRIKQ